MKGVVKIFRNRKKFLLLSISLFLIIFPITLKSATASTLTQDRFVLPNGLEVILIENHSIPVVACVVTVKAGSAKENLKTSGISHMLEHLLFNGTANRTQKEIYEESDFYGIYNNAHTERDFTNFIVLAETNNAERALELQSDMLFNSIIPEDKFEKEKGIILNEIAKDISIPSFFSEEQFNRFFFLNTPYNLPIIGIPESIKNMKREMVVGYYKKYYVPNNATAIIMGNFDKQEMMSLVEKLYGKYAPGKLPEEQPLSFDKERLGMKYKSKMKVTDSTLNFGALIPSTDESDFYPVTLAGMVFDSDLKARLNKRLSDRNIKPVQRAWAGVDFNRRFALFRAELTFSPDIDPQIVEEVFYEEVKEFATRKIEKKNVEAILTASRVEEVKLFEKPHYFGMMKGKFIATRGWDFMQKFPDRLEKSDLVLEKKKEEYFKNMKFMTSLIEQGESTYLENLKKINKEYYSTLIGRRFFSKESIALFEKWNSKKSESKKSSSQIKEKNGISSQHTEIKKVILDNGLTLLINSNYYSEVFGLHLLARNRAYLEPVDKRGIADFLHRLMVKGTVAMQEKDLNQKLSEIGAEIKTHDSPLIPYDDHYTSPEYSFLRFDTIDKFADMGMNLVSEIVKNPTFRDDDIEAVREQMISLLKEEAEDPGKRSDAILSKIFFKNTPLDNRIMGDEKSITSITKKDIQNFHSSYFSPENLVISVSTSHSPVFIIDRITELFGALKRSAQAGSIKKALPLELKESGTIKERFKKTQSYITIGKAFKILPEEKPALRVLGVVISEKIAFELREKDGLAYTLGAEFSFYDNYALFKASMGTQPATLEKARERLKKILGTMGEIKIEQRDIERIVNLYISRAVMRRLSRINQSYFLGLEEFYGLTPGALHNNILNLRQVTLEEVKKAAGKYMKPENFLEVVVE